MPITTIEGLGGSVTTITGFNGSINAWSMTVDITIVETSGFTDKGYRVKAPTCVSATGSFTATGQFDAASTTPIAAAGLTTTAGLSSYFGTLTLQAKTGCTYAMSAVISQVSMNRAFDGKLELTFNFESSGRITQTWDQT